MTDVAAGGSEPRVVGGGRPAWVLVDPASLRVVAADPVASRWYGWRPELGGSWVDGQVVAEVVVAAAERRGRSQVTFALASGELQAAELSVGRAQVAGRDLLVAVIVDADGSGGAVGPDAEGFARSVVAGAPVGIAVADLEGRLVQVNPALCRMLGRDEGELVGQPYLSVTHPEDRQASLAAVRRMQAGESSSFEVEKRYLRGDGGVVVANVAGGLLHDAAGRPSFQLAFIEDVTEHRAAQQQARLYRRRLASTERRFEALVEHATDLIIVVREDGTTAYASPTTRGFLGLPGDVSMERLARHLDRADLARAFTAWRKVLRDPGEVELTVVRARRADGQLRQLAVTLTNLCGIEAVRGVVINARDMTDEYDARARLEHQASHDVLTGLANRPALLGWLEQLAAEQRTGRRAVYGLALLDLDGMGGVNDRFGHHAGDYLLRSVAARLAELIGDRGMVARTSGDEFAVLVPGIDDAAAARELGRRVLSVFAAPYVTPGSGSVRLTARVGIALTRDAQPTATGLLQDADVALAEARRAGAGRVAVCDRTLREREQRRLTLEHDLTSPQVTDQLHVVYQPLVELATGRPVGLETLLRWDHPEHGTIGAEEFIPLAEQSGAIVELGAWVLQQACCQLATWSREPWADNLHVSVNVSARQLLDVTFATTVEAALRSCGLAPDRLWLEVTETALADTDQLSCALDAIRQLGVRIHIDDFGTGYSSLAQLRQLPFDGLKIDRSFIDPVGRDREAQAMIAAIRTIAAIRGLQVVAEGVETDLQRDTLYHLGCPWAQGYLWSPPVVPTEVPALLATLSARAGAPQGGR